MDFFLGRCGWWEAGRGVGERFASTNIEVQKCK